MNDQRLTPDEQRDWDAHELKNARGLAEVIQEHMTPDLYPIKDTSHLGQDAFFVREMLADCRKHRKLTQTEYDAGEVEGLIRLVEYRTVVESGYDVGSECPFCGAWPDRGPAQKKIPGHTYGHKPDCHLAKRIAAVRSSRRAGGRVVKGWALEAPDGVIAWSLVADEAVRFLKPCRINILDAPEEESK